MLTFISVIHIIAAVALIGLVLAQDSKSSGMGMLSGGGSSSVFGATGGENILAKGTKVFAAIFAGTCIILTIMSASQTSSVVDDLAPSVATDAVMETNEAAPAVDSGAEAMAPETEAPAKTEQ